ncbi:MAG: hypothetical protein WAS72_05770 [Saprospiraceae bacterium]
MENQIKKVKCTWKSNSGITTYEEIRLYNANFRLFFNEKEGKFLPYSNVQGKHNKNYLNSQNEELPISDEEMSIFITEMIKSNDAKTAYEAKAKEEEEERRIAHIKFLKKEFFGVPFEKFYKKVYEHIGDYDDVYEAQTKELVLLCLYEVGMLTDNDICWADDEWIYKRKVARLKSGCIAKNDTMYYIIIDGIVRFSFIDDEKYEYVHSVENNLFDKLQVFEGFIK